MVPLNRGQALSALTKTQFDIAIIGGGIVGCALAWDASLRGARVALVERGDFGGATTGGNFKIIHGGLRYLQHLDLSRILESAREQFLFRKNAPHLVHPLPFLIPCYGYGKKGKELLQFALSIYQMLTKQRNRGIPHALRLPNHRVLSAEECIQAAPGVASKDLRGGVLYYDCQMSNSDRLTLSFALGAAECQATVANYVEVEGFEIFDDGEARRIQALRARDRLTGQAVRVEAKVIINACGPWIGEVDARLADSLFLETVRRPERVYSKGIQLMLPQLTRDVAVLVQSSHSDRSATIQRGGRSYFIVPWEGCSLIGTADALHTGDPDSFSISPEEVELFLAEMRQAYTSPALSREHVRFAFGGLRPVDEMVERRVALGQQEQFGTVESARRDRVEFGSQAARDNGGRFGAQNFVSVEGIKYTTVRGLAEEVIDRIGTTFGVRMKPCQTRHVILPGGEIPNFEEFEEQLRSRGNGKLPSGKAKQLIHNYGTRAAEIVQLLLSGRPGVGPIDSSSGVLGAEILVTTRQEMVCSLEDAICRRVPFWKHGLLPRETLMTVARLVGTELGWDSTRIRDEVQHVEHALRNRALQKLPLLQAAGV